MKQIIGTVLAITVLAVLLPTAARGCTAATLTGNYGLPRGRSQVASFHKWRRVCEMAPRW
jgi:hypothetical protein